ncbi:hypothetical protein MKW98_012774 [Papaver atlanticum]|uniref:20 kDa chaperonin, chloroplastic n=1 Tax=Papaver atlanticum TaxID=357466 RepID=A0AAD4SNW5_9MAGN|nr:hypothetical protein MKW98_012774 [Papaver atlanticum]
MRAQEKKATGEPEPLGFSFPLHPHSRKTLIFSTVVMATVQVTGSGIGLLPSFDGLSRSSVKFPTSSAVIGSSKRSFRGLVVKAANVIAPKYTTLKPLGDRVLVKIKTAEQKTTGGILLPSTAQTKPQGGEVVAIGEGKTVGKAQVDVSVKTGAQVIYSKYAGTEVDFNGVSHLILKEDDIVGILETEDVKDLKPLSDRVLIKVEEAEKETAGGLLLTEASKEKPSIGTVVAVGPGPLDEEGKRKLLSVAPGNSVLYSKYAGNDFKGADGSDYIALRAADVMAVLA